MQIVTTKKFDGQYRKQSQKVKHAFGERIGLFVEDPRHPLLRVHKLSGKFNGLWSFNVTGDVRVVFDASQSGAVILVAIGTHSQLYT